MYYYSWVTLGFVFVSYSADCKGFKVEHSETCSFLIKWLLVETYNSGIPEYPIFQLTLKYLVALFSILVCMVEEATRLSPRKVHLGRDLGKHGGRGHALRLWHPSSPLLCGCYVIECIIFQIKPCNLCPVGIKYR